MRNHERAFGERLWRAAVIAFGILGAFAAIDAILFFFVLVGAAIVFEPSPYLGLLMFVALPAAAVVGAAVAWTAYQVLTRRTQQSQAEEHHVAA